MELPGLSQQQKQSLIARRVSETEGRRTRHTLAIQRNHADASILMWTLWNGSVQVAETICEGEHSTPTSKVNANNPWREGYMVEHALQVQSEIQQSVQKGTPLEGGG